MHTDINKQLKILRLSSDCHYADACLACVRSPGFITMLSDTLKIACEQSVFIRCQGLSQQLLVFCIPHFKQELQTH